MDRRYVEFPRLSGNEMDASAYEIQEDKLEWTGDSYTVNEIFAKFEFPCLVKACEGIYDLDGAQTFSNGDYLKLHGCETIEKARAYPTHLDSHGRPSKHYRSWANPLLIPLDYKTLAKVIPFGGTRGRYPTVELLLKDFPHYVRVGAFPITTRHLRTRQPITIPARAVLELVRKIKDMGTKEVSLICNYDVHEIELEGSCPGDFYTIPDEKTYTLRDIVAKFPFPQVVELSADLVQKAHKYLGEDAVSALSNMAEFQGKFVIESILSECKVFGSHRLDLESGREEEAATTKENYRTHQAIVVIPRDSDALFQVATNKESFIYQTVFSKNYGKAVNTSGIGALYMDFQGLKTNNEFFVPLDDSEDEDHDYFYPDPIDPIESEYMVPCTTKQVGSNRPKDKPPKRPPRTDTFREKSAPIAIVQQKPKVNIRSTAEAKQSAQTNPAHIRQTAVKEAVEDSKVYKTGAVMGGVRVLPTVKPKPRTNLKPSASVVPTKKVGQTDNCGHDTPPVSARVKTSVLPISQKAPKTNKPHMDMTKNGVAWHDILKMASVKKVGMYLRDLGLSDKVQIFADNDIDGAYLLCLSDDREMLSGVPLYLSPIEILKLQKFVKEGKLPYHKNDTE